MQPRKVIILGTRGIPAQHGGFETFAEVLSLYLVGRGWDISVYCQRDHKTDRPDYIIEWQRVKCVNIKPLYTGKSFKGLSSIFFDMAALWHAIRHNRDAVWLTLGYNTAFLNILPWLFRIPQIFNMDGIEWKRPKWPKTAKAFLYLNYYIAGRIGNVLIADHPEIAKILKSDFTPGKIVMIPYGSHPVTSADHEILDDFNLKPEQYFLLIARIEPENNILPIVKAWSATQRLEKLVIVGNYLSEDSYSRKVRHSASKDVIFTGPVYNKGIIAALRYHCKAYMHGHSVGGTNPTLVESLGAGTAIIAHDNIFNRWTAGQAAVYFQDEIHLEKIFSQVEDKQIDLKALKEKALKQHQAFFEWQPVLQAYEDLIESQF